MKIKRVALFTAPKHWVSKPGFRNNAPFKRRIVVVDGWELRHNITYKTLYMPRKDKRWPAGTVSLVVNGVNHGPPNEIRMHGVTWRNVELVNYGAEGAKAVVQLVPREPKPEPKLDLWEGEPTTRVEHSKLLTELFAEENRQRKHYFDTKARWRGRFISYAEFNDAAEDWADFQDRYRKRMDELVKLAKPLWEKAKREEAERRRKRLADASIPVDLTDPKVRREYYERNRRLEVEQHDRQQDSLSAARAALAEARADPDIAPLELRARKRRVERIEWELGGFKDEDRPWWLNPDGTAKG